MSDSKSEIFRLVLMPEKIDSAVLDKEMIIAKLKEIGFLGTAWDSPDSFIIGERFFDLISFLGCSPNIKTEPQSNEDRNFCHIRIREMAENRFYFYYGRMTKTPSCPDCKTPLKSLKEALDRGESFSIQDEWLCDTCQSHLKISSLNWRKSAGFAPFSIEIWSIYPNEAVPNDFLMGTLQSLTTEKWKYIYA